MKYAIGICLLLLAGCMDRNGRECVSLCQPFAVKDFRPGESRGTGWVCECDTSQFQRGIPCLAEENPR